ncbi:unnamed protein product [Discula destructiva]
MSFQDSHKPFLGYSDDPEKEEARQFRHLNAPSKRNTLSYIAVCFATSLFWAGLFYLFNPEIRTTATTAVSSSPSSNAHNVTTSARLLTCGDSVASARAAGCKYDILLNNWVPAPCFDQEFIDEYMDDGSWGGYADEAMTQKLTPHEMSERESYWTSLRDHVNHCAMMWRKQFWVLYEERRAFDTVIASPGHTDHCAQFLVDAPDRNWTHPTRTQMGFAGCWVKEDLDR